jgi:hypothetical protein
VSFGGEEALKCEEHDEVPEDTSSDDSDWRRDALLDLLEWRRDVEPVERNSSSSKVVGLNKSAALRADTVEDLLKSASFSPKDVPSAVSTVSCDPWRTFAAVDANGEFATLLNTLMGDFTKVHVLQVVEGKLKSSSPLVRFDSDLYFSVTLLASSSLAQLLVVLKRRANIVVKEGGHVSF